MPESVEKQVMRDFEKYANASPLSAEKGPLRNYLELIGDLPWKTETVDTLDMAKARSVRSCKRRTATSAPTWTRTTSVWRR